MRGVDKSGIRTDSLAEYFYLILATFICDFKDRILLSCFQNCSDLLSFQLACGPKLYIPSAINI